MADLSTTADAAESIAVPILEIVPDVRSNFHAFICVMLSVANRGRTILMPGMSQRSSQTRKFSASYFMHLLCSIAKEYRDKSSSTHSLSSSVLNYQ